MTTYKNKIPTDTTLNNRVVKIEMTMPENWSNSFEGNIMVPFEALRLQGHLTGDCDKVTIYGIIKEIDTDIATKDGVAIAVETISDAYVLAPEGSVISMGKTELEIPVTEDDGSKEAESKKRKTKGVQIDVSISFYDEDKTLISVLEEAGIKESVTIPFEWPQAIPEHIYKEIENGAIYKATLKTFSQSSLRFFSNALSEEFYGPEGVDVYLIYHDLENGEEITIDKNEIENGILLEIEVIKKGIRYRNGYRNDKKFYYTTKLNQVSLGVYFEGFEKVENIPEVKEKKTIFNPLEELLRELLENMK